MICRTKEDYVRKVERRMMARRKAACRRKHPKPTCRMVCGTGVTGPTLADVKEQLRTSQKEAAMAFSGKTLLRLLLRGARKRKAA